jgi:uncharacterized protein involved in type VI secretion and phage assembly
MSTPLLDLLAPRDPFQSGLVYGVVIGIVTNNQDPDNQGRVKVRYPWLSDDEESSWARIASFMAGPGRGGYFLPEVDDEVLVAFDHGDVRYPYVIGALWNGQDDPPENNSNGENNIRVIRSRNGHEVRLDDKNGSEKVEITSKSGHVLRLDDAGGGEKIELIDKTGQNSIRIKSSDSSIAIECTGKLTIRANGIEINSMTDVRISGNTTVNVSGSAAVQVRGGVVNIN